MVHVTRSALACSLALGSLIHSSALANDDPVWRSRAESSVAAAEYELSEQVGAWQAPNRAHGFRAWFTTGGVRLVPRDLESASWSWELTLLRHGRRDRLAEVQHGDLSVTGPRGERDRGGIVEWYVNDPRGLEQGFTLETRPPGSGEVVVDQALSGSLRPLLSPDGQAIDFLAPDGVLVLRFASLTVEDARGQELAARMEVFAEAGAQRIRIAFDDAEAVYPVTVDPLATSWAWRGGPEQASAWFGYSVSTAGDVNGDGYSDVIVGAPAFDNGQSDEGRAFVYLGSASGVSFTPIWTAESDQDNASFGWSVSTAGDVNGDGYDDVIVGAYAFSNGESQEGRAWVYYGSASGPSTTAAWTFECDQASANLGYSVAAAGDVNGDGYADVLVGIPYYDNGQSDEGRVYAFHGSASGLSSIPDWIVESNQASSEFGGTVASAGDVNGDGYADVIIGARYFDNVEFNEGRAFVYLGTMSGLSPFPVWTAEPNQAFAAFGASVATAGDVNGDGYADVIVGAPDYDSPESGEGRVSVYLGSAAGPQSTATWSWESNQASARAGISVATAGDTNGDGYADVIVGAHNWDVPGGSNEGRALAFLGSASGLATTASWDVTGSDLGGQFGISVATAGDVNGDGFSDAIVGAYLGDTSQSDAGRAFVFHGAAFVGGVGGSTLNETQPQAHLGYSIAGAGDVNGDGYSDVIVGAYGYDGGLVDEGRADLYLGSATGLGPTPVWTVGGGQAGAAYGGQVATAGDVNGDGYDDVVIGAPSFDAGEADEGQVFVYLGSPSGPATIPAWTAEGNQEYAYFGTAAGAAGDVNADGFADLIVGAYAWDDTGAGTGDAGRAFLYLGSPAGPIAPASWIADGGQTGAYFAISAGTAGDVNRDGYSDVIIGAPLHDNGSTDEGRAYVYLGSPSGLASAPSWTAETDTANTAFGRSVGTAGDYNGDGYADVIVGWSAGFDRVSPFHGSASGLVPDLVLWPGASPGFGEAAASAGDVNGDGYSDVIVGASGFATSLFGVGRIYLYPGGPSGLWTSFPWTEDGTESGQRIGLAVAGAGDVNGDGFADLLFSSEYSNARGGVRLRYGNASARPRLPRQLQSNGTTPIALRGVSDSETSIVLQAIGHTAAGRGRVRLLWEIKPLGSPFTGTALPATSPQDTGTPGASGSSISFSQPATGLSEGTSYHWRARTVSPDPFFPRSPWFASPGGSVTETRFRTAGCVDRDGDGFGAFADPSCTSALVDCDDSSASSWDTPGTTGNLRFASATGLTWDPPAEPGGSASSLVYDTLRSGTPYNFLASICIESNDGPNTTATDGSNPPIGQAYFYLGRAQNSCPQGDGSVGTSSAGVPRAARSCP